MTLRHSLSTAFLCGKMGFKNTLADPLVVLGSLLIYGVIMTLYAGVIHMISDADLAKFDFNQRQMIWYLGLAELFVFAVPSWCFSELQNDIHSGQLHLAILRPLSPLLVRSSIWTGESAARVLLLILPVFCLLWALAGSFVLTPLHILGLLLSLPLAIIMNVCAWYIVGASCLWLVQSEPAYWIWQKCCFLFGAMLWPLAFYPLWLQVAAWATPFPAILAAGARWALSAPLDVYAFAFLHQMAWAVVLVLVARWFDHKILRYLQRTGA